jgi:hypothetical protein
MPPIFPLLLTLAVAADEPLAIRVAAGQELVYQGQFTDESRGLGTDRRFYELEIRAYILEAGPSGARVAFQTVLRGAKTAPDGAGSVRFELTTLDSHGRLTQPGAGKSPLTPLDGPPSLEPAGFIALPSQLASEWDAADGPRPPRSWRIAGDDFANGVRCVKLVGEQESAEWRRPTGNVPAWRRGEVVWLTATTGIVQRLERTIERHGGLAGAYTSRIEYELKTVSTYPDALSADCRREIRSHEDFSQKLAELLAPTGRAESTEFASLLDRIDRHVRQQSATPFRPALLALRRRVETAMRGEVPPPADAPDPPAAPPALGQAGPDFIAINLVNQESMRLARWHGKPTALLFIRPDSVAASPTLQLAADLQTRYADRLHVAVLVVSDEDRARPSWADAAVPLFAGRFAAEAYGVTGASRVVVLDADGIVRHLGDCGPGVRDAVHRVVTGN